VFWLAKMDALMSISAAAMDTSRIGEISKPALTTWRVAFLAILPGLVIAAGMFMFIKRRD
jgi:hypothetical protein